VIDTSSILVLIGTFILGGTFKGVIGLGLVTISLALLTVAINLPTAMALLIVPSFVTNIWQAFVGRSTKVILRRIWPFLLMATITVWLGTIVLTRVNLTLISTLLGVLLIAYSFINLCGFKISIKTSQKVWVGILTGAINGVLTGMTGSFVVPGVMFLQSINLPRDALIQAMGMLFTVSSLALGLALRQNDLLTNELGVLSLAAVLPAIVGMIFGQMIRKRLSEQLFRKVFFISLLVLGLCIIVIKIRALTYN
jgi:uncharacterized membrane protein YfcA